MSSIGIKKHNVLSTNKNLNQFKNQFQPYEDMFECNLTFKQQTSPNPFSGTLIRLPFRVQPPAVANDCVMSSKLYDSERINKLSKSLETIIDNLLLFTQNVSTVKLSSIPESASSPKNMTESFSVTRKTLRLIRDFSRSPNQSNPKSILKISSLAMKATPHQEQTKSEIIEVSKVVRKEGNCLDRTSRLGIGNGNTNNMQFSI